MRRPAVAVALLSEAQPPTRDFEHRDPGVDVGHHTCQLEASSRIAAILIRIHGFDPYPPTNLDHNALGEEKFRVCSQKGKLSENKNPATKGGRGAFSEPGLSTMLLHQLLDFLGVVLGVFRKQ
jgi:hypothetical protein